MVFGTWRRCQGGLYNRLKDALRSRCSINTYVDVVERKYYNLKLKNGKTIPKFAMRVEKLGLKLKKTGEENLERFILGLEDSTYQWVKEKNPGTVEEALRVALKFQQMFGHSG